LRRIDLPQSNLLLFSYLFISGVGIVFINLFDGKKLQGQRVENSRPWILSAIQFSFGGLFSGFVLFYFRSASIGANWLFILILASLLIGNETFKKRYARISFQMSIFFFTLLSFSILYVPIVMGKIGDSVFIISGVLSIVAIGLFLTLLRLLVPSQMHIKNFLTVSSGVVSIYIIINIFYFTNILPPIPLSLKDMGVYHYVERVQDLYIVQSEKTTVKNFFQIYDDIHLVAGDPLYVYSAVFAPTDLKTKVIYHWQYYDEKDGEWLTTGTVAFPIVGGRDGGYRGYSKKDNFFPGRWRVTLETERGQIIGQSRFRVINVDTIVPLQTEARS
jgi:hypothetical protein